MPTILFRGTRAELVLLLETVPSILAGRTPDTLGVARSLGFLMSNALLSQIHQDLLAKARGGRGRDGVVWAPLSPATLSKRLRKNAKAQKRKGKASPVYAGQVEIGRDTGRMFKSLSAGVDDQPPANPDTVVRLGP